MLGIIYPVIVAVFVVIVGIVVHLVVTRIRRGLKNRIIKNYTIIPF